MDKTLYNRRRKSLGELLKLERKFQRLEQVDIARRLGVRQEQISKIEAGTRRIDILELIDYCEALNFSLTEFAWKIENFLFALSLLPYKNSLHNTIRVDVSWCENKFSASFGVSAPKAVMLTADRFEDLQQKVENALDDCIKRKVANGDKVPRWLEDKEYELEFKFLDVTSLLKAYSPFLSLATISRVAGINQNLLSQYANGLKMARPYQLKRIIGAIQTIGKELVAAAD